MPEYHFSSTWVWHRPSSCRLGALLSVVIFYINNSMNRGDIIKAKGNRSVTGLAYLFIRLFIYFRRLFSEMLMGSTHLVMPC